jgi:hypothetical protein
MKIDESKTCSACGTPLLAASEFCPVCMLRIGLEGKIESGNKLNHAVFVSYSSDDKEVAGAVCAALEAEAIRCWMAPRDFQGGRPYPAQITQAIREARVLLLVLSQASNRSKQVLREVERVAHCQNYLLTFRIEAIAPGDDLAYFLEASHWVDGFPPLPPSQHFPALVDHTRKLLQSSAFGICFRASGPSPARWEK